MKRRLVPAVSLLIAAALALAACGSSSKTKAASTGAGSATAGAPAANVSGAPIVIGAVGSFTGPGAAGSLALGKQGLEAWASWTNSHGGVNGHPVKVDILDDANNASTSLANVKQLVEQDHVVAIIDANSDVDTTWTSYLDSAKVPVIGTSQSLAFGNDPNFYPTATTALGQVYGELYAEKQSGATKLSVLYCAEIATCAQAVPFATQVGKGLGISVVYNSKISSSAADYTAPCLASKDHGANALAPFAASPVNLQVAQNCASQSYHPTLVTSSGVVTSGWASNGTLQNTVGGVQDVQWFDTSLPSTKQMHQALQVYQPAMAKNSNLGELSITPFVSGQVFAAAAKAVGLAPGDPASKVVQGLDTLQNFTADGLAPPLTYTAGKPTTVGCFFTFTIKNKAFTEPNGTQPSCQPSTS